VAAAGSREGATSRANVLGFAGREISSITAPDMIAVAKGVLM
jgi:hypothetical protein